MGNSKIKPVFAFAVFIALAVTFVNYFCINQYISKTIQNMQKTIESSSKSVSDHLSIVLKCDRNQRRMFEQQKSMLNEHLQKMEKHLLEIDFCKKGIIDSNVLTFLVSFVLIFLAGLLFNNESRAKKLNEDTKETLKKAEKTLSQLEVERNTLSLYSQILALRVLSMNCQNAIDMNVENSFIFSIYRTLRMATEILGKFREDNYLTITTGKKKVFDDIFENIISDFNYDPNSLGEELQNAITVTIEPIQQLREEISRLREE